jgi:hypothetical protein
VCVDRDVSVVLGPVSGSPYPSLSGPGVPVDRQPLPGWKRDAVISTRPVPTRYKRVQQLQPGDWIVIFGTASRVLKVEDHRAYPNAVLLRLNPAGFAGAVQTLVPADYEPLVLPAI